MCLLKEAQYWRMKKLTNNCEVSFVTRIEKYFQPRNKIKIILKPTNNLTADDFLLPSQPQQQRVVEKKINLSHWIFNDSLMVSHLVGNLISWF